MEQEDRKKYILSQLESRGKVGLKELADRFSVSEMTVRRDFNELEHQGLLIRKYGGAVKSEAASALFSFNRRVEKHREQKQRICGIAQHYIQDGEIIFIDCGTTLFRLAALIKHRSVRVITNSLPVVSELLGSSTVKLTVVGGDVDSDRKACYGSTAEKIIRECSADKAFIGTDGISLRSGMSSFDEKEGRITRAMAHQAREVFLLCDASKIERDSFYQYAPVSLINHLITDSIESRDIKQRYREAGIEMIT